MHWLTALFVAALLAGTALRLWLASRQLRAVRAHRDHVPAPFVAQISLAEHRKAADYTVARTRLARLAVLVGAATTLALTIGGGIAAVDALWQRTGWPQPWHGTAVVLSVLALASLIGLPLAIWRTFAIEARFGFNRTTPALFLADLLKGALLTVLLGGPLLLAILALMERSGAAWWLWAWMLWLAFALLVSWAWPAFIAPWFNRFTPLEDRALRERVDALLERCGVASRGVYVMDGSRRSVHGNAYFTGIGRHKRVVFFDTLLERLDAGEVEAVLAHELGHWRLRHIARRLLVSAVGGFAGFALLGWLAAQPPLYAALGVPEPSTHAALLLFLFVAPVFTFFAAPLGALWSRRDEYAADGYAARHSSARALAEALVKLYRDNATTLTPDPVYSAFYDSHPPALARIARLRG